MIDIFNNNALISQEQKIKDLESVGIECKPILFAIIEESEKTYSMDIDKAWTTYFKYRKSDI